MTSYVVFLALFLSAYYVIKHGVEATFLQVWLPIYLCIPFAFTAHIPLVPIRTFAQAAAVPLLLMLVKEKLPLIRVGLMEGLLIAYVALRVVADFLSRGYSDAQNYAFYMLSCVVGPYLMGSYVINSRRMDIATIRKFVLIFMIFFPMFLYEAKFWVSPIFKLMSPLFPDASSGLSIRWGLARTAGTFEHPILACIMIIAVYRLHRWVSWTGEWERPQSGLLGVLQKWSRRIPLPFHIQISIVLILMALMTISRGPWIGGLAAGFLVAAGNVKNRQRALIWVCVVFVLAGALGKLALDAYTSPAMGVLSDDAKTMLYRKVMIDQYMEILMSHMWWGWGLTTVPKIAGMESVDNAFFLMALQHGVIAPALFAVIFFYAIFSQLRFGLKAPAGVAPLGFTFSGVYLMCFVSFTTVYMGAQTEPLLFLLLGWGEGIKARGEGGEAAPSGPVVPEPSAGFRRVMT